MPTVSIRPPVPPPQFLIGNFPLFSPDPLAVFTRWAREFGDIFYYRAGWIDVYFLNHPDLIESVLLSQSQHVTKDKVIQKGGSASLHVNGSGWPHTGRRWARTPKKCWQPGRMVKSATFTRR